MYTVSFAGYCILKINVKCSFNFSFLQGNVKFWNVINESLRYFLVHDTAKDKLHKISAIYNTFADPVTECPMPNGFSLIPGGSDDKYISPQTDQATFDNAKIQCALLNSYTFMPKTKTEIDHLNNMFTGGSLLDINWITFIWLFLSVFYDFSKDFYNKYFIITSKFEQVVVKVLQLCSSKNC